MVLSSTLDSLHSEIRQNKWMRYFAVFCRCSLALGFIPSGFAKISGERFTSLSNNHPMGQYLEALFHTGYYYTFIGIAQVTAAILLLIPRTAILGALLYFPIILNICILSLSVRFEGSLISSPLMLMANLYLFCWYYDKIKFIFPFNDKKNLENSINQKPLNNKFPLRFFTAVATITIILVFILSTAFDIKPANTINDCISQSKDSIDYKATCDFCNCIHKNGLPLDTCLKKYRKSMEISK